MLKRSRTPEDVRIFIIERLAGFESPKTVADAVRDAYGLGSRTPCAAR